MLNYLCKLKLTWHTRDILPVFNTECANSHFSRLYTSSIRINIPCLHSACLCICGPFCVLGLWYQKWSYGTNWLRMWSVGDFLYKWSL